MKYEPIFNKKDICAGCGIGFENSDKNYYWNGNYCNSCVYIVNKDLNRKKLEHKRNKLKK